MSRRQVTAKPKGKRAGYGQRKIHNIIKEYFSSQLACVVNTREGMKRDILHNLGHIASRDESGRGQSGNDMKSMVDSDQMMAETLATRHITRESGNSSIKSMLDSEASKRERMMETLATVNRSNVSCMRWYMSQCVEETAEPSNILGRLANALKGVDEARASMLAFLRVHKEEDSYAHALWDKEMVNLQRVYATLGPFNLGPGSCSSLIVAHPDPPKHKQAKP